MATAKKVGDRGEEIAGAFLRKKGYLIVEVNYRIARGELDIIARDGATLVFVEVKSGRSAQFGPPESWVTPRKQRQLGRLAAAYLQRHHLVEGDCRFDVVAVTFRDGAADITHIENAFWL